MEVQRFYRFFHTFFAEIPYKIEIDNPPISPSQMILKKFMGCCFMMGNDPFTVGGVFRDTLMNNVARGFTHVRTNCGPHPYILNTLDKSHWNSTEGQNHLVTTTRLHD